MLGQFVDDYTVNCIDVFAMPQSGTGVSVEAVDPVFQTKMLDMLKQTGRPEVCKAVAGWRTAWGCAFVDVVWKRATKAPCTAARVRTAYISSADLLIPRPTAWQRW